MNSQSVQHKNKKIKKVIIETPQKNFKEEWKKIKIKKKRKENPLTG